MPGQPGRLGRQVDHAPHAAPPLEGEHPGRGRQQVSGPSPNSGSSRRMRSTARYSSSIEPGSLVSAWTVKSRHAAGWGSHGSAPAPAGEKPNGGSAPAQGSGTRLPSRPGSAPPARCQIGSCRCTSGMSCTSQRPSSSPWYTYTDPGRAMVSSAAALARRVPRLRSAGWAWKYGRRCRLNPVSGRPSRETIRSTSWLDSTQVAGALTGACSASVLSMTSRSWAASHGQLRYGKLNTVCSSPGLTYRASRAASGIQISPISTRPRYSSASARQDR